MQNEQRLRQIYNVVLESWRLFKAHSGEQNSDSKWETIMSETNRIYFETAKEDEVAKQIIFGFVSALETEDIGARKKGD